jgi:iron complex transport system ATP-binding protein
MSALLTAQNITFAYPNNPPLLNGFEFSLKPGDFSAIIGPNGAGKSTVLRLLSGFQKPSSGAVLLKNQSLHTYLPHERSRLMAVVTQDMFTPLPYTVRQIVEMGRSSRLSKFALLSKQDHDAVDSAIRKMDIWHYRDQMVNNLSGGERQRVMIAMAMAQEPELLLLDEPTSQLDIGHASSLLNLIAELNRNSRITVLIITHDIQLISNFCHKLHLMKKGTIIQSGPNQDVLKADIISDVYNCQVDIFQHPENNKFFIDLK